MHKARVFQHPSSNWTLCPLKSLKTLESHPISFQGCESNSFKNVHEIWLYLHRRGPILLVNDHLHSGTELHILWWGMYTKCKQMVLPDQTPGSDCPPVLFVGSLHGLSIRKEVKLTHVLLCCSRPLNSLSESLGTPWPFVELLELLSSMVWGKSWKREYFHKVFDGGVALSLIGEFSTHILGLLDIWKSSNC